MLDVNKFAIIRDEETPEKLIKLAQYLQKLTPLNSYANLEKGDRIIRIHESCVCQGAGTPNLRWVPITTVTEDTITRVNQKTYSFVHTAGYRTAYSGKIISGCTAWRSERHTNGFRNNIKVYVLKPNVSME